MTTPTKSKKNETYICIDSIGHPINYGIHLYLCNNSLSKKQKGSVVVPMSSVRLDREQAAQLIQHILERLK